MTAPRLPVSEKEYEAALAAARPQLTLEVEGNRASGVEMALVAAHAVLVPRIERALNATRQAEPCETHERRDEYGNKFPFKGLACEEAPECDDCMAQSRAAFWRAMGEK